MTNILPNGFLLNGKYTVRQHIASGGFGSTYIVTQNDNKALLAVKELFIKGVNQRDNTGNVIVPDQDNTKMFNSQRDKFIREARTLLAINNIHVVRVFDCFVQNNTAYYVMEFIDGMTLAQKVRNLGPLNQREANAIFVQVLDALFAIHQQKVLHLDIKPANIMIDNKGIVKIIDFGTAKIVNDDPNTIATFTPVYAPLELQQQDTKNMGPWTDLFSLGATLYFMITNKKPPTSADIIQHGHEAFDFPENIPQKTRKLIVWMMSNDKNRRPQSVGQVINFLETDVIPESIGNQNSNQQNNGDKTIYVNPNLNNQTSQCIQQPNNDITNRNKEKNKEKGGTSEGCVWTFVIILLLLALGGYALYKYGFIDSIIRQYVNKDNVEQIDENDISEQETIILKRESEFYDKWTNLIDNTQQDIKYAQSVDDIQNIIDIYQRNAELLRQEYNGIELNYEHQKSIERKNQELNDDIEYAIQQLKLEEYIQAPPQLNDEYDYSSEDDYANDGSYQGQEDNTQMEQPEEMQGQQSEEDASQNNTEQQLNETNNSSDNTVDEDFN